MLAFAGDPASARPQATRPQGAGELRAPRTLIVATSEGAFAEFGDPCASRAGWLVFHATRDDGRSGIYLAAGGAPAPLAESGGIVPDGKFSWRFRSFGRQPTVNEAGICAFTAVFAEGGSAVLTCSGGAGGEVRFVADSGEAFRGFGDCAAVNAAKWVAFQATVDPDNHPDRAGFDPRKLGDPSHFEHPDQIPAPTRLTFDGRKPAFHEGLFIDRGIDLQVAATTTKDLLSVQDGIAFNDAGAIAYRGCKRPRSTSLLLSAGGGTVVLAESGRQFLAFELPAIDLRGRVAFVAHTHDGVGAVCRATRAGGLPEVLADAQSGFVGFGAGVAIDDSGRVAFVGRRADGRDALWLATGYGAAKEMLAVGDVAGRRVIRHLRLGNRAFGRADRIVLLAELEPDAGTPSRAPGAAPGADAPGIEAVVQLLLPPGR